MKKQFGHRGGMQSVGRSLGASKGSLASGVGAAFDRLTSSNQLSATALARFRDSFELIYTSVEGFKTATVGVQAQVFNIMDNVWSVLDHVVNFTEAASRGLKDVIASLEKATRWMDNQGIIDILQAIVTLTALPAPYISTCAGGVIAFHSTVQQLTLGLKELDRVIDKKLPGLVNKTTYIRFKRGLTAQFNNAFDVVNTHCDEAMDKAQKALNLIDEATEQLQTVHTSLEGWRVRVMSMLVDVRDMEYDRARAHF
jgi:hypothetical protein